MCKLIKVYQITVEERADLAKYPPVCLPEREQVLPKQAFVYGGFFFTSKREVVNRLKQISCLENNSIISFLCMQGWGKTDLESSATILQKTNVKPIY